jgi:hypothetical protein
LKVAALRSRYGAGPLHLIAVIASFGIAGYAFIEVADHPGPISFAVFFAGAIVAHDLIAFPLYSLLNLMAGGARGRVGLDAAAINYVRVPALLSGFAFVVWFPLILGLSSARYEADTGHAPYDYLGRWLLLSAALFVGSGLVFALRWRARSRGRATDPRGLRSPR